LEWPSIKAGTPTWEESTSSSDFPTLHAFQPANADGYDLFVTVLNAAGNALVYSTYLGGSSDDFTSGIAFDQHRNVYVQGSTSSTDLLVANPAQPQFGGGNSDGPSGQDSPADAPGLGLSRLSVNFGPQAPGTTSAAQVVTVRNVGSQLLVVYNIHAEPPEFAQTNTCTAVLAPYERAAALASRIRQKARARRAEISFWCLIPGLHQGEFLLPAAKQARIPLRLRSQTLPPPGPPEIGRRYSSKREGLLISAV